MPRIIVVVVLLFFVVTKAAPAPKITTEETTTETTESPNEDEMVEGTSMGPVETETVTIEINSDIILTTDPEGQAFTEPTESLINTTEEPLPDSVLEQLERERGLEDKNQEDNVTTTTQKSRDVVTNTTQKTRETTTEDSVEATTDIPHTTVKSMKNYFERKSSNLEEDVMEMGENRMETVFLVETTTMEPMELEDKAMTTEGRVETTIRIEMEEELTTNFNKPEETTIPVLSETSTTEVTNTWSSTTESQPPLPTTLKMTLMEESAETSTAEAQPASSTTETSTTESQPPLPTTVKMSLLEETAETSTTESPAALPTTVKITLKEELPVPSTSAPVTTTVAPSTISPTTESSISTTKQMLLLQAQPETTTSTTSTTSTTPRPIQTRAPRIERIFNSDGVEVLYGYSSVVRTHRS